MSFFVFSSTVMIFTALQHCGFAITFVRHGNDRHHPDGRGHTVNKRLNAGMFPMTFDLRSILACRPAH